MNNYTEKKEKNLWSKGKEETKKFYDIKFKFWNNVKIFIGGIILTIILILPLVFLVYRLIRTYFYDYTIFTLLIAISWTILMFSNGLSNYLSVKIAKGYGKDRDNLQKIDENAIFFYQFLNVGFAAFTLIILILFSNII
ncbi:MAG: hypothetical protein PHT83_01530 [Bacilli bacterium]|nr:hypothetical protein [Bacilli bacterium]